MPGQPASVLIADAAKAGVELSAEMQSALRVIETDDRIVVMTPWTHALSVVVDFGGDYRVFTMSAHNDWTGEVLAQIASRWAARQVFGENYDA